MPHSVFEAASDPLESDTHDPDDLDRAIEQFRNLCIVGSQSQIEEFLSQTPFSVESLNCSGPGQLSALHEAAKFGHLHIVIYLTEEKRLPLFDEGPNNIADAATEGAVKTGNTDVLEFLIGRGWDVNATTEYSRLG